MLGLRRLGRLGLLPPGRRGGRAPPFGHLKGRWVLRGPRPQRSNRSSRRSKRSTSEADDATAEATPTSRRSRCSSPPPALAARTPRLHGCAGRRPAQRRAEQPVQDRDGVLGLLIRGECQHASAVHASVRVEERKINGRQSKSVHCVHKGVPWQPWRQVADPNPMRAGPTTRNHGGAPPASRTNAHLSQYGDASNRSDLWLLYLYDDLHAGYLSAFANDKALSHSAFVLTISPLHLHHTSHSTFLVS